MNKACFLCKDHPAKIFESRYFFVILDDFPLRKGHLLIVTHRHVEHLVLLTREEFCDLQSVIQEMVKHVEDAYQADGYNIGINGKEAAGQTIPHVHIHLVPRYTGDVPSPHNGIRDFLPKP